MEKDYPWCPIIGLVHALHKDFSHQICLSNLLLLFMVKNFTDHICLYFLCFKIIYFKPSGNLIVAPNLDFLELASSSLEFKKVIEHKKICIIWYLQIDILSTQKLELLYKSPILGQLLGLISLGKINLFEPRFESYEPWDMANCPS